MNQILICDRDKTNMEVLQLYLRQDEYQIHMAKDKETAIDLLKNKPISLLLLDPDQEEFGGLATVKEIRSMYSFPILLFSKINIEQKIVAALNSGADDYIIKPYNPLELAARIHAQVRRYSVLTNLCENISHIYRVDDLEIDDTSRRVCVGGKEVRLTPLEYSILSLLVKQKGKVLTIEEIYESIWHMRAVGVDNTIAVHIRHIREKIEQNPKKPRYLKVIWGTGYKVG